MASSGCLRLGRWDYPPVINMAMENGPFIYNLPSYKPPLIVDLATFDDTRRVCIHQQKAS